MALKENSKQELIKHIPFDQITNIKISLNRIECLTDNMYIIKLVNDIREILK